MSKKFPVKNSKELIKVLEKKALLFPGKAAAMQYMPAKTGLK